jgi:hypothetical protein
MPGLLRISSDLAYAGRLTRRKPLIGAPARVERHDSAEADMADVAPGERGVERLAGSSVLELPEELANRPEFVAGHALLDVDAVDAEVGQFADGLARRLGVRPPGAAVEVHVVVDGVDANGHAGLQVPQDDIVELGQLLGDDGVAGGVHPGEASQAHEPLENGQRVGNDRDRGCLGPGRRLDTRRRSDMRRCHCLTSLCARRPTRESGGFQKRKRSGASVESIVSKPSAPVPDVRSSSRVAI